MLCVFFQGEEGRGDVRVAGVQRCALRIYRKALPVPEQAAADLFEAPQGEAEQALAAVWADLFGLERAGRHDDFFALGGDSILALKLVARARKRGVKLTPKQLFTGKTPAGVARLVEGPVAGAEQTEGTATGPST